MTQMLKNVTWYIFALMGDGKTMIAVSKIWNRYLEGYIVISNIPLAFPHIYIDNPYKLEALLKFLDKIFPNVKKVLLLDEFDKWLIARLYKRDINIVLSQVYGYTRKYNCDVYMTGHRLKNLDVMIRGITNYFAEPTMNPEVEIQSEPYIEKYGDDWEYYYEKDYKYLANEMENNYIEYDVYNAKGLYIDTFLLEDLISVKDKYDTKSTVKPLI